METDETTELAFLPMMSFIVLGDNSPISVDSRAWEEPGDSTPASHWQAYRRASPIKAGPTQLARQVDLRPHSGRGPVSAIFTDHQAWLVFAVSRRESKTHRNTCAQVACILRW